MKKEDYFDLIRNKDEKTSRAYFDTMVDYFERNQGFDKVAVYQLLDFLKQKGHLSNLSHDAITSFIKYL